MNDYAKIIGENLLNIWHWKSLNLPNYYDNHTPPQCSHATSTQCANDLYLNQFLHKEGGQAHNGFIFELPQLYEKV